MNVTIHSQGVALTEALCLYISERLQHAAGRFAPLVEQTRLDITTSAQRGHKAHVQCRLTMTVTPSPTISLAVSASTPSAAIGQATEFLKQGIISPVHLEPTPAVRIPVAKRIPATTLFRRCTHIAP